MTSGADTKVRIRRRTLTKPHSKPNFFISEASVIFTALAERTRNITEILNDVMCGREKEGRLVNFMFAAVSFEFCLLTVKTES